MWIRILILFLFIASTVGAEWTENNGKREWTPPGQRTRIMVSHELEIITWPGLPDSTYFKIDVGSITDTVWYSGDTTTIGISEYYHARFYNIGNSTLEWEAILYQKPGNQYSWTFPMESENLVFHYQPELTQEEINEGFFRPDNVVGSYAVYHSFMRDNWIVVNGVDTTYEHYANGKAFHIYRPKAWDSAGDTVWLDLDIDTVANELTITGNRQWFRNAVYPVIIDPKFGNENPGASEGGAGSDNKIRGGHKATTGADAGGATLDSNTFYVQSVTSGPYNVIWGLYDDNSGPDALVCAQTSGESLDDTGVPGWKTTTTAFGAHSLSASTVYYFTQLNTASTAGNITFRYDSPGGTNWYYDSCCDYTDYPNLPNPFTADGSDQYLYSVYGWYTVAGAPAAYGGQVIMIGGQ